MAREEDYEEEVEQKRRPKYGATDIRRYTQHSGRAREFTWTRLAFLLFVFALLTIAVYGYYYLQSPQGLIFITNVQVKLREYNPFNLIEKWLERAQDIGNVYGATANSTSSEKGIVFKDFKLVGSEQIPQGAPAYVRYDVRIINDFLRRVPVKLYCGIRDKDILLELRPSDTIQLSGSRVTEEARCYIDGEITRQLEGSQEIVGRISFPYKTENVGLNVYFVSDAVYNELREGEDFFSHYGISESNPVRPLYNGEPVEIGIGVSSENLQPVVLREGVSPLVGITLRNSWDGRVVALYDLKLQLPEGVEINKDLSQNPNLLCPFEEQPNARNEYGIASHLKNSITIDPGRSHTFECWLNAIDVLEPGTPYTKRQYKVSAEYEYESRNRTATLLVRSLG